ncbi:type II toxin-antitoxin system Phd/YefM family antitoxin [Pseudactinotalea sp. Z1748]|uniref:type II toxin-antitoxin system Phd/YefM family antitoxin n=1 Tax=Pseudactinotalea sp. Z1748 TaxID=3413027 RepID=UPI003C7A7DCA
MDVPVSTFRSQLKHWIERVGAGEELIITERGVPVARLTGVDGADLIASLERDGLLSAPETDRPSAPAVEGKHSSVSELVRRLRR